MKSSSKGLSSNTIFNVFALVSVATIAGLCAAIVLVQDRNALNGSIRLVSSDLQSDTRQIGILNKEYAYWDQAVTAIVEENDAEWVANELASYVYESAGIDRVFVFDGQNKVKFRIGDGELAEEDVTLISIIGVEGIIDEARLSPDNEAPQVASGFTEIEGTPYLTSAVRMTTYDEDENDFSTDHVLVFAKRMSEAYLAEQAAASLVKGIRFGNGGRAAGEASVELPIQGRLQPLRLFWKPDQPGSAMVPWLLGGLFVFAMMVIVAGVRFNRRMLRQARQLAEAREISDRASQQKSDVLASISHELRTPLNAIIGFAEMMQKQFLGPVGNPRYIEYAGDIMGSGQHLLSLVNGLLDLSKIEAGKFEVACKPMQLDQVVGNGMSMVRHLADEKSISTSFDIDDDATHVIADDKAVTQILVNLLSNALKFTPEGGTVSGRVCREGMETIIIEVADSGIGISPADLESVMEPFYQVEVQETASQRGTGLGLSVSRKLAELMGGTLTLQSELGHGTTAILTLPRAEVASQPGKPERADLAA